MTLTIWEEGFVAAGRALGDRAGMVKTVAGACAVRGGQEAPGIELARWVDGKVVQGVDLEGALVIVGGCLLGGLQGVKLQRRVAAALADLPPLERDKIAAPPVSMPADEGLERRLYEVFLRVGSERHPPRRELSLVGLYAFTTATAFREWERLGAVKQALSPSLGRRVDLFRRAAIRSSRPEVTAALVEYLTRFQEESGRS